MVEYTYCTPTDQNLFGQSGGDKARHYVTLTSHLCIDKAILDFIFLSFWIMESIVEGFTVLMHFPI